MPDTQKSSPAKAAAARANGEKSNGPKTDAGKYTSSQNATKHGCSSTRKTPLLVPGEDPSKLQACTDAFYRYFCPQDLVEAAIVDTLVAQTWRAARVTGYESELLTSDAEELHPTLADRYESINISRLFALAFRESSIKNANPLVLRYLVSSRNMYRSALADLVRMRMVKGNPENPYLQPPQFEASIAGFCIDPSILPVPDAPNIVPPTPDSPQPAAAVPPQPESQPRPEATPPPEPPPYPFHPEPQPQPEPLPQFEPEPQPDPEPQHEEPPMIPYRDPDGAIYLSMAGHPIMLPNPKWVPTSKPVDPTLLEPPPLSPYEKYNVALVPLLSRPSLPNEPKPPLSPSRERDTAPHNGAIKPNPGKSGSHNPSK